MGPGRRGPARRSRRSSTTSSSTSTTTRAASGRDGGWPTSAATPRATCPRSIPPGTAKKIPAGSDFIFQIHYTPNGKVRTDRSQVGLIFAKAPVEHGRPTPSGIAEADFLIPPHQDNVAVASSLTFAQDDRLLSFMPHMHLRGKDFQYTITCPGKPPEVAPLGPRLRLRLAELLHPRRAHGPAQGDADRLPGPLRQLGRTTRTTPTRPSRSAGATRPSRR